MPASHSLRFHSGVPHWHHPHNFSNCRCVCCSCRCLATSEERRAAFEAAAISHPRLAYSKQADKVPKLDEAHCVVLGVDRGGGGIGGCSSLVLPSPTDPSRFSVGPWNLRAPQGDEEASDWISELHEALSQVRGGDGGPIVDTECYCLIFGVEGGGGVWQTVQKKGPIRKAHLDSISQRFPRLGDESSSPVRRRRAN